LDLINTLITIGIALIIGIVSDRVKPKEYYYENRIVTVYKKYQCPKYCQVDHFHYVYFENLMDSSRGMCIDKEKLGERYKETDKEDV
jgi:hypothetical protein